MISELYAIGYCCEDIQNIENYEAAVNDDSQMWVCHHRNEIDMGLSADQLIRKHLYYERPASELIFLTNSDHTRLHNNNLSEKRRENLKAGCIKYHQEHEMDQETRDKISNGLKSAYSKGLTPWNKGMKGFGEGHSHTEETKKHLSERAKERWSNPEFKEKMHQRRWGKIKGNEQSTK